MEREIELAHGAGGEAYRRLVEEVFLPAYGSKELAARGDSALCTLGETRLAMTTDGFVVRPLFFPGGDVGRLAVCGTVNDLAVSGAVPRFLSVAMILEAGLPLETLRRVAESIAAAAREANVSVVTGDTKVVERGRADGIYITTAGVGAFDGGWPIPAQAVRPGDAILVSGPLASHGMAVMAAREALDFEPPIKSDCRPLASLIASLLSGGAPVNAMRDPTRGGLGATLYEWTDGAEVDIIVREGALPVREDVRAACALLGLDALFAANEGVCAFAVPRSYAQEALGLLRAHPDGRAAALVGEAVPGTGRVLIETELGALRLMTLPVGELLPRIC